MRLTNLLLGASLLLIPGCGGGGGGSSSSSAIPVNITPPSASLDPSASQQFSASIPHVLFARIVWSVQEANGGTITASGLYTAPALAGTYHVVATGFAYNNAVGIAPVTVHIEVLISPGGPVNTTLGQTQQFTTAVLGTPNTAVTWSVLEASGATISSTGLFSGTVPGTYHVIATSVADPTQQATVVVNVQSGSASGTIQ